MPWPGATDYTTAVQNPEGAFGDVELRAATPECNAFLGLPLSYCGNFAIVFKLIAPSGEAWAVKCFTREVTDHRQRYAAISRHLDRNRKRFAVEFGYLDEGIRVAGQWYPCVKMRWVEGHTLNEFLRDHAHQSSLLEQLGGLWLRLASELRECRMAHGDLQHGNVLLVPGKTAASAMLRLVDYDGMWVPELDGRPPAERGHPNYQHPQRLKAGGYSAELDRFAHLAIYTSLRCLKVGGKAMWDRHDNGENLLFKEADFARPGQSKLFPELLDLHDDEAAALAGHLIAASQGPLDAVPLLADLMPSGAVQPLSGEQRDRLAELVPTAKSFRKTTPVPKAKSSPRLALGDEQADALAAKLLRDAKPHPIPTPVPPPPGATGNLSFGDYELLEELARGVSWRIYRARQAGTGRVVLLRTLTVEANEPRRVLAEAEGGTALVHPNIQPSFEVGQRDGVIYLVSADAPGGTLTNRLPQFRHDPLRAVPLLVQAARAVQYAHQRFVLHRALGPDNILLDADGSARVVGFGLAARSSRVGRPFGSGPYAAPEVVRGEENVTPTADVWSLGAILYEGLTGQPPVLEGVKPSGPAPPWEINRDADHRLSDIALWCLKADPRLRYPNVAKVAAELEGWVNGDPVVVAIEPAFVPPPLPRRRTHGRSFPWPTVAVACALLLLLVGGGAWVMTRPAAPRALALDALPEPECFPGGSAEARVAVEWDGRRPHPVLSIEELPDGVSASQHGPREAGDRLVYAVTFDAGRQAAPGRHAARVTLSLDGAQLHQKPLRLTILRPSVGLGRVGPLTVAAGRAARLAAELNLAGPRQAWAPRLVGLPAGVREGPWQYRDGAIAVDLSVPVTTKPGAVKAALELVAGGEPLARQPFVFQVLPNDWEVSLKVLRRAVVVEAGVNQSVVVQVERTNYGGPLSLRIDNLPPGVIAAPVTLAPEERSAAITLEPAKGAGAASRGARVVATADGVLVGERDLLVSVTRATATPASADQAEGYWTVTRREVMPGAPKPADLTVIRIEGGRWHFLTGRDADAMPAVTYTMRIDASRAPAWLTLSRPLTPRMTQALSGLIKIDGDEMTVIYTTGDKRPTEFRPKTVAESLMVLKRSTAP